MTNFNFTDFDSLITELSFEESAENNKRYHKNDIYDDDDIYNDDDDDIDDDIYDDDDDIDDNDDDDIDDNGDDDIYDDDDDIDDDDDDIDDNDDDDIDDNDDDDDIYDDDDDDDDNDDDDIDDDDDDDDDIDDDDDDIYDDDDDDDGIDGKLPPDIIYKVTKRILKAEDLLVVDGIIWRYDPETGAFYKMEHDEIAMFIESFYTKAEYRIAKSSLAGEVKTRICRQVELQEKAKNFNAQTEYINCANGVIHIGKKSCRLKKHDPKYRFTYCIDAKFLKKKAKKPTFKGFSKTSFSNDKKSEKLLLEIIGYSCSDLTTAKKIFFFKGEPDSGKSVLLRFIEKLVGIHNVSHIPLHELDKRFNKIELFTKKLNTHGEMKNIALKDISCIKAHTGGDMISAEYKHGKHLDYYPTAKLIYAGNALPLSAEDEATKAFINRVCLLIFPRSIAKEDQNPDLGNDLWNERNAIFTAAVNTLPKLIAKNFKFTEPENSLNYLCYYESTANSLDMFLTDCCVFDPNASIPVKEFQTSYKAYCDQNVLEIIGRTNMNSRLLEKHKVTRNKVHRKDSNVYHYMGIRFKNTKVE